MNLITADIVADLIGFDSPGAFLRARDRLQRDTAFPAPMPTCLRPMKWRHDAILAWLEAQGKPAAPQTHFTAPNVYLLDEARRV